MAALSVTATSVIRTSTGSYNQGTAGASITAGQPIYIDSANGYVIKPANGDSLGASGAAGVVGYSIGAATSGQTVTYAIRDTAYKHGFDTAVVNAGDIIYLDDTAGGLTKTYSDLDTGDNVVACMIINTDETTAQLFINSGQSFTAAVKA